MRLFISYARVDKPYCVQIAETLDIHDIWYDQRLYAGQQWWKEILRRLDWCEGFVYLLSPESVASEYCQKEFEIARNSGRHIFPVLIHNETDIPEALRHIQYADLSEGLTTEAVKTLLNAIYLVELRNQHNDRIIDPIEDTTDVANKPGERSTDDLITVVADSAEAMETGNYDRAVFLLKQAIEREHTSRFINLDVLLREAETALARQMHFREAEREYKPIAELVRRKSTRKLGCQAFQAFQRDFPDYDPDNIASTCLLSKPRQDIKLDFTLPLLEWCRIEEGMLLFPSHSHANGGGYEEPQFIEEFYISRFPVTNAQFQAFIDDPDGYANSYWWEFAQDALRWRSQNPAPKAPRFRGDERPRENVTWYEAMAFCHWLSEKTHLHIALPNHYQWQRAARGDDTRLYPWGNEFDTSMANTRESKIRMTTQVMRYEDAISPFGLYDMAGNVWEWCIASGPKDSRGQEGSEVRAIYGGSFISDYKRAETTFHFNLNPEYYYATIGFRIVAKAL